MALLLSSCAVPIANERWYGDLGSQGAVYFETLSTKTGYVDKATWDQMRVGMACTSIDTLKEIKSEIEKLCSATACDYQAVESVLGKFQSNLERVHD